MAKKMSTGTKAMIGIAVVGAAAGLGYYFWKKKKAPGDPEMTQQGMGPAPKPGTSVALPQFNLSAQAPSGGGGMTNSVGVAGFWR